jgi:hypothetical protein
MAFGYTPEQIQDFKKKDLQVTKTAIIKSFIENHGELPSSEFIQDALKLIYTMTEIDKTRINPEYIPNTPDGQPFVGNEYSGGGVKVEVPIPAKKVKRADLEEKNV